MCAYASICSTTYPPEVLKLKPTTLHETDLIFRIGAPKLVKNKCQILVSRKNVKKCWPE